MPLSFEQQTKESDKAYAAFGLYLSLGPERSTATVAKKLGKSAGLIERWCTRHGWPARVQAHAAHLATVEREATEALTRAKGAGWVRRQETHREEEWTLRGELIEAGRKVLEKFRDGSRGATLGDVARALDLASKLGRLASGMATDKTEVTGESGGPIRVELTAALNKIYGEPLPGEVVDVEVSAPAVPARLECERGPQSPGGAK
jgi:hypothetical protein